ncbi:MAG: hypothetical protein K0U47_02945 [Epsilonproteobacteria bacterium]|nr:hypothetical protein [Campylobacterota bacterium]
MYKFIIIIASFFLLSCGGGDNSTQSDLLGDVNPPSICNAQTQKQFVYDVMHDSYLWADETKVLSAATLANSYSDDKAVLEDLKVAQDEYSYIVTKTEYENFFQAGVNRSFGFLLSRVVDNNNTTRYFNVDFVHRGSSADSAGLRRGDQITHIDEFHVDQVFQSNTLLEQYFNSDVDLTVIITLSDTRQLSVSKEEFTLKTVAHQSVIEQGSNKVGYLVFHSFIGPSIAELEKSFSDFKEAEIDELVLDLRYNGGGYIYVANYLASLIGGINVENHIFNKTIYNQKYSRLDEISYFQKNLPNALDLSRVFIITTKSSCSASELVINSLAANTNGVEVIQVGDATCGKPYGMLGAAYCDNYILPVQMESTNEEDVGDYTEGLNPTCQSEDDVTRVLSDLNETSLSDVLYYIDNGSCRVNSRRVRGIERRDDIGSGFRKIYGLL